MKRQMIIKLFVTGLIALIGQLSFAYDFESDGIYYEITSTSKLTCKVVKGEQNYSGAIVIPSEVTYRNRILTVTSIDTAFTANEKIISVALPNSVTEIVNDAFFNCTSLISIEIPNSVTRIGWDAFFNCTSLTSIEIPNSVTSIGFDAFYGCTSLTSIEIPNSVTSIGFEAFYGCTSLTSIEIPNSVTVIDSDTFRNCTSLTSIEIPNSVTSIGFDACYGCTSLTSIDIPNSVTVMGSNVFNGCIALESIILSENLSAISYGSFCGCEKLSALTIPGSVQYISLYYRDKDVFNYLTFPENLSKLSFEYGNEELRSTCNKDLYVVEWNSSIANSWLNKIETVFFDRQMVKPMELPALKELCIGEHLKEVQISNVQNNPNLTKIISYAMTPPTLPKFSNAQYTDVVVRVPNEALEAYSRAEGWKEFWDLEGFDTTGIDEIKTSTDKTEIARYNLLGAPVNEDYKGIVIIRFSDGSTKKLMNK